MTYSQQLFHISKQELLDLIQQSRTAGLNAKEEHIIEQRLLQIRGSDEHISLFQIDNELKTLEQSNTISKFDRAFVMNAFTTFCDNLN